MKVYEAIASAIEAEGADTIFGLMGDGNMWLWATLAQRGRTKFYWARHENYAVVMADGYSRTTGRVGVASVTHGPGLTQVATALMTAARNATPLVLIAGDYPAHGSRMQWMNQARFAEACDTRFCTITHRDNVAREVADAFFQARTKSCPVLLNLPIEIQEQDFVGEWSYRPSTDFIPPLGTPRDEQLEPLVEALMKAERPVIVAGRGAQSGQARDELIGLADLTGALLSTTLLAKDWFDGHPYNIGLSGGFTSAPAEKLFRQADLVLGVGAQLGYFTTKGGALFPGAKIARIDIKPLADQIGWTPSLYVQGDARATVARLNEMLADRQVSKQGFRNAQARAVLEAPQPEAKRVTDGLDLRVLMRTLSESLPERTLMMLGGGHFVTTAIGYLPLPAGSELNFALQFAAIGQGLACAIGIGAAHPGRPNVLIEGDGSLLMSLQELETVVRHKLQLVVIVCNDGGYGAEVHKLTGKGFDGALAQWRSPDFVGIARAVGGDGRKLATEAEIGPALAEGLRKGGLFVIDAPISATELSDAYATQIYGVPNQMPLLRTVRNSEDLS